MQQEFQNKYMHLKSNKNAYEQKNIVEKSNYFSKGLANKNFKLGHEGTGRLEQNSRHITE